MKLIQFLKFVIWLLNVFASKNWQRNKNKKVWTVTQKLIF